MSGSPSRHRDSRVGFTLVETAIAILVLLLGLGLALDLFLESARITAAMGARSRDPMPELALDRLRSDLRTARPPRGMPNPAWTPLPLTIQRPYATPVTWTVEGDRLIRVSGGSAGPVSRPHLGGVLSAAWRSWPPGHYEVRVLSVRESPSFVTATRGRFAEPRPVVLRLLVAPRGEGDGW